MNKNPETELCSAFMEAIGGFIEHRRRHGGILLPDELLIRGAFQEALYEFGISERPKPPTEIPIIGRKP